MKRAASIFLRADIKPEDGQNIIKWIKNPNVTKYLNESSNISTEIKDLFKSSPSHLLTYHFNQNGRFYLVCSENDISIGFIKLRLISEKNYEIVFAIGEETLWGNGFGKKMLSCALNKAFFEKRADNVIAKIYNENHRSVSTVLSCGMKLYKRGQRLSAYYISIKDYLQKIK